MKRRRIGLLFGGPSSEHQISIASAKSVAQALNQKKYSQTLLYIDRTGRWWGNQSAKNTLQGKSLARTAPLNVSQRERLLQQLDCALPIFHGQWGEDGTIQAVLEFFGVPYIGSGVAASALCMDKARSRAVLKQAGIQVPRTTMLKENERTKEVSTIRRTHPLPVVVKPNRAGSSVGISLVHSWRELLRAIRKAAKVDSEILVERYLPGRELTVAVLGGARTRALPVIEIRMTREFFDWKAKYADAASGDTQELCPAPIPKSIARRAQQVAVAAHQALGCRGLTRTDMILSPRGQLTVLEVNTMPGLTANSLAPRALRAADISMTDVLDRLIIDSLHS